MAYVDPFIPISQAPHLNWLAEKGLCLRDLFSRGVPCARSALTVVAVCEKDVWGAEGNEQAIIQSALHNPKLKLNR
jgi:hypothetical protein